MRRTPRFYGSARIVAQPYPAPHESLHLHSTHGNPGEARATSLSSTSSTSSSFVSGTDTSAVSQTTSSSTPGLARTRSRALRGNLDHHHPPQGAQLKTVFKTRFMEGMNSVGQLLPFWKEVEQGQAETQEEVVVPLVPPRRVRAVVNAFESGSQLSSSTWEEDPTEEEQTCRNDTVESNFRSGYKDDTPNEPVSKTSSSSNSDFLAKSADGALGTIDQGEQVEGDDFLSLEQKLSEEEQEKLSSTDVNSPLEP